MKKHNLNTIDLHLQFDKVQDKQYVVGVCQRAYKILNIDSKVPYNTLLKKVLMNGVQEMEKYIEKLEEEV